MSELQKYFFDAHLQVIRRDGECVSDQWPDGLQLYKAAAVDARLAADAARIEMLQRAVEWQPIETAPVLSYDPEKWYAPHSERILLLMDRHITIGSYHYTQPRGKNPAKGKWREGFGGNVLSQPTHWMPLPAPPAIIKPAREE